MRVKETFTSTEYVGWKGGSPNLDAAGLTRMLRLGMWAAGALCVESQLPIVGTFRVGRNEYVEVRADFDELVGVRLWLTCSADIEETQVVDILERVKSTTAKAGRFLVANGAATPAVSRQRE